MPVTGFQAFVLCGPGESLSPFNSNPREFPKALVPIANRPMVWYPLDWCYRTGISNIILVTPAECAPALEAQLQTNPYLTSLPHPRPTILTPRELTLTTGTAEIFRLPEVQDAITTDFVVLPCDLVCDLPGSALVETYMTLQAGLGTAITPFNAVQSGRGGALGVWYETKDAGEGGVAVKKEATDFLATIPFRSSFTAPRHASQLAGIEQVAITMPTDSLKDVLEEKGAFYLRKSLVKKHDRVKLAMTKRDAHLYFFPHWAKDFIRRNESFESIGEDVLGWWAKATWQTGLGDKLQMQQSLRPRRRKSSAAATNTSDEHHIDLTRLSSTSYSAAAATKEDVHFASRVVGRVTQPKEEKPVPPILSYIHPALEFASAAPTKSGPKKVEQQDPATVSSVPLIRRVDTTALLLSASLYLARYSTAGQPESSAALSHQNKVHPTSTLPTQATIDQRTVLIDANCSLAPRITLRECVLGANVKIASGARLTRCVVMADAVIEEKCILSGCIVGRRCVIGKESELRDCQVQEGYAVPASTSSKGEVFAGFEEGDALMEGTYDDDDFADEDDEDQDEEEL